MIYLITGLMASGKSTVAELLAKRFEKAVHLRGDTFRKVIVKGREEMSSALTEEALEQLDLRYRITAMVAKEYHRSGFTVVVQDNYYGEKLAYMADLILPEPLQIIVLCPNAEAIRRRENQRNKAGYQGFAIEGLYEDFMGNTPRLGRWIDTSNLTPAQTVDTILPPHVF